MVTRVIPEGWITGMCTSLYRFPNDFLERMWNHARPDQPRLQSLVRNDPKYKDGMYASAQFCASFLKPTDIANMSYLCMPESIGVTMEELEKVQEQEERLVTDYAYRQKVMGASEWCHLEAEQLSKEWFMTREACVTGSIMYKACGVKNIYYNKRLEQFVESSFDKDAWETWQQFVGVCDICLHKGERFCWHCNDSSHLVSSDMQPYDAKRALEGEEYKCKWQWLRERGECETCTLEQYQLDPSMQTALPEQCKHYCQNTELVKKWGSHNQNIQFIEDNSFDGKWVRGPTFQESVKEGKWFIKRGIQDEYMVRRLHEVLFHIPSGKCPDGSLTWNTMFPGMATSPDAVVDDRVGPMCSGRYEAGEYKYPKDKAYDQIPRGYLVQCMAHCFLSDRASCMFISFHDSGARIWRVFRSVEAWLWIMERVRFLWFFWAGLYADQPEFKSRMTKEMFEQLRREYAPDLELPIPPSFFKTPLDDQGNVQPGYTVFKKLWKARFCDEDGVPIPMPKITTMFVGTVTDPLEVVHDAKPDEDSLKTA